MNKERRFTGDIVCLCLTVLALIIAILIRGYLLDILYELNNELTREDIVNCKTYVRLSNIIITVTGIGTLVEIVCLLWKIYGPKGEKCE